MASINLQELTIAQAHTSFRRGDYTAEQLVTTYLQRIQEIDRDQNGPKLNSLLALNPNAVLEARKLDDVFKVTSQFIGPLHGIPIVIKDQAETKGIPTTFGSVAAKDFKSSQDANLVKKLRNAGAIILAKSTMPDWASDFFSTSTVSGSTRNPYALDRDPGGSSSGTAAAIAANLGLIGIGEDTSGSIRVPASFCNLVGFRPTVGLVTRHGFAPLIKTQDTPGPMGRTVRDVAVLFDSMVGFDEEDPYTSITALAPPPIGGSYGARLGEGQPLSSARLGVLHAFFGDEKDSGQADVKKVVHNALQILKTAAASEANIVDVDLPNLPTYLQNTSFFFCRSKADLDSFLKPVIGTTVSEIYEAAKYPPGNFGIEAIATYDETASYAMRLETRDEFLRTVMCVMIRENISAIVFPTARLPAPLHSEIDWNMRSTFPTNTWLASQLRLPAISVPVGFTKSGLPVGLELVGMPFSDQKLLELAYGIEQVIKARTPPSF